MYDEIWKPIIIDELETNYLVSNYGRVYSKNSNKLLKPNKTDGGYLRVTIYTKDNTFYKSIHRLVAIAFLDNPDDLPEVNHKDGNKENNYIHNLEWCTKSYNERHAYENNLKSGKIGDTSHFAVYPVEDIKRSCELMEEGILTIPQISSITRVSQGMLFMIKHRRSWTNISKYYDVENCRVNKSDYSDEEYEQVFQLLQERRLSVYEVMNKTGVKTSTIYNIIIHKLTKHKYLYELYDIPSAKEIPKGNPLPSDVKEFIYSLIKKDYDTKQIVDIVHNKYELNKDQIRHFITRNKYKKRSTTRES